MFSSYLHRQSTDKIYREKSIYLVQNGYPDKLFTYKFSKTFSREEIMKVCEKNWGSNKYKNLRLFSIEGVQILDEDLQYIRDNERIYISKGEDFDSNRNFGEYQLIKVLGEGGFGKVSLGKSTITHQLAAIKVMKLDKITGTNDIDMIFREIQNLKALNHPNIVKILNCYTLQSMQVVVVMEYLEGGELLQLLKEKKIFQEDFAKKIFKQLISAVNYCHKKNIIHRDLKLQNILLKSRDELIIKVADFGISGVASQFNPDVDTGTLKYMSPEVLSGKEKSNTPAVDVWACGIILYYMLYGFLPFNAPNNSQNIQNIIAGKFIFPKTPVISEECQELIQMILQINPKKRIKMCQINDSSWLISSLFSPKKAQKLLMIQNMATQNLIKTSVVRQVKKSFHNNKYLAIPKRLQKEKQKILNELEGYNEQRKVYKSENKPLYCASQELPSINHLRGSKTKFGEEQGPKKKKPSLVNTLWK